MSKIKHLIILMLVLSASKKMMAQDVIIGIWQSKEKDKTMYIEIYRGSDNKYYGKSISNTTSKNGTIIIKGLTFNSEKNIYSGTMMPPDAAITVNITVKILHGQELEITAKKFLLTKILILKKI